MRPPFCILLGLHNYDPLFCTQLARMLFSYGVISRPSPFRRSYVITHKIREKREMEDTQVIKKKEKEKAEKGKRKKLL